MANNIYKFPGGESARQSLHAAPARAENESAKAVPGAGRKTLSVAVKTLWIVAALVWPVLRWIMALDVAFQALLMVWHWGTPGNGAMVTFLLHFAALVGMTFFVSVFKPKSVK